MGKVIKIEDYRLLKDIKEMKEAICSEREPVDWDDSECDVLEDIRSLKEKIFEQTGERLAETFDRLILESYKENKPGD